ncbi:hypothetical protein B0W47_12130 [Komagataeibacter nataicola]|uniref:Uncharacterized protein n=1 Tax=Komagataeibacter nataicola TaxID=265960 RepID=A0A9N7CS65_9PROT|nr:hypothetical protein [Komagataeibacter nataicola]AQU88086.1 hypothetical protein B0W47_12130 [Komagataeibacter nataicola]PYD66924.1 hypothetical protein CDI09_05875 [Komagataeibacter nataicola]WEQ54816.1 hypothetical protein LV564_11660 [Komagataeibacter nataicola]GBR17676.1 hypothetical protein AA0616_1112 [Komagataeibacter nataicola NRIC 0616]
MATSFRLSLATACALTLALSTGVAQARETSKTCHAKFTAARTAGTLGTQSYKEFKAVQCDTDTAAAATPAAPAPAAAPVAAPAASKAATPVASTSATMPTAVADKYSKEAAGKGRLHTCLDQYNANKATNANGGLRWIQKGGGYYSICNAKLKG